MFGRAVAEIRWWTDRLPHRFTVRFLHARRSARAVLAVARCFSARVCHKSEFYRNGWTGQTGFLAWRLTSTYPTLWSGNSGISKIWVLHAGTLIQISGLMVRQSSQCVVSLKKVDAQCDILNRRWSNEVDSTCDGRCSTDDLGLFITLSVHRCVQHDSRGSASRGSICDS